MRLAGLFRRRARVKAGASHAEIPAGGDLQSVASEPHGRAPAEAAPDVSPGRSLWSPLRLEVAEALWGEGAVMPGGADEMLRLALPFGLTAATSVVLLGCGSLGVALRLAGELGVWVTAYESDPVLASTGARRLQRSNMPLAKRAVPQTWDPGTPAFRRHGFNHAVAVESLAGPQPEAVLVSLAQAVKPGGQMALLETVAAAPLDPAELAVADWCRLERREPPRAGTDWIIRPLLAAGWQVRTEEDISARQVKQAVTGWRQLVREMHAQRPSPRRAAVVVAEAELWLRRVRMLRAGRIRVMRWHLTSRA